MIAAAGQATKRVQREYRRETVDKSTGEIVEETLVTESRLPKEPDFIKLYLKDIMYLQDLPTGLNAVLYQLLTRLEYDGTITVNGFRKEQIAQQTKLSVSTINHALTKFVQSHVLDRIGKGTYRANPYLFGKGNWKDIHRIRMEVSYSLEGKTIKSVIESKDGEEVQSDS